MAAGLATHGTFEGMPQALLPETSHTDIILKGDASMTRQDAFFGDNHSLNLALLDQVSLHISG